MVEQEEVVRRPNLSVLAMVSFIASFMIARTFTTLRPNIVVIGGDFHIHHFWYGIALLAIGGWLGISYESYRINRLAAILFGAGGGVIGDEFGLLLTFGDYWTGVTYTLVIILLTFATALILVNKYSGAIKAEFSQIIEINASLYLGVFLMAVSMALIFQADNLMVMTISGLITILAFVIVLGYLIQRIRLRKHNNELPKSQRKPKRLLT
jgi:hypothetical protein